MTWTRRDALRLTAVGAASAVAGCLGRNASTSDVRPVTGFDHSTVEGFDDAMLSVLKSEDIDAAVAGIAEAGEVTLNRGYGWANPERSKPLEPSNRGRIASLGKTLTAAGIRHLAHNDSLDMDAPLLSLLPTQLTSTDPADDRFHDITIRHVLNHEGGWNRHLVGDPLYRLGDVASTLELNRVPTPIDVCRYMLDQPLQFTPGTATVYSNVGYLFLGRVIEAAVDESYPTFIESEMLEPAGISSIEIGTTAVENRPDDELWYAEEMLCRPPNVSDVSVEESCPSGGLNLQAFDSAGGHIAGTVDLLAVLDTWWLTGTRRDEPATPPESSPLVATGTHPGSHAVAWQSEARSAVVICNRRVQANSGDSPLLNSIRTVLTT